MKKFITRALLVVVILVVVGGVVLYLTVDGLIRSGVESAAGSAVGQKTTLEGASLHALGGNLSLRGLDIANPKDFSAPQFLTLQETAVSVVPSSLLSDTVVIDTVKLDGLHLTLEQNGLHNNLKEILDQIQKQTAPTSTGSSSSSSGKNLKINTIQITNTEVTIRVAGLPGQQPTDITAKIPLMELKDPTNPDGRPMKLADLLGKVLIQVAESASAEGNLPGNFQAALKSSTNFLHDPANSLLKQFGHGDLGKGLKDLGKELGKPFNQNK